MNRSLCLVACSVLLTPVRMLMGCEDASPTMTGSGGAGGSGGTGGSAGGGTGGSGGSSGTGGACDPVAQNCPTSQRCTLGHTQPPATFCETIAGTGGEFQSCRATATSDNCDRGFLCFGSTATSYCSRFCNQDGDCGTTGWCTISLYNTSLHLCTQRCSVIAQDCTQGGYACYLVVSTTGEQRQACQSVGNVAAGQPCTAANACQRGTICVAGGGGHICEQACDPNAPSCPAGTSCHPYAGQDRLGTCF